MIPTAKPRRFDAPEPAMRAAGAWLARRDRGFTAAEQAAFNAWRFAHPDHTAAIAQLERTMTAFAALRELAPDAAEARRPNADFFAPRGPARRRWLVPFGAVALAAAAAIAVLFVPPAINPDAGRQHYTSTSSAVERLTLADGSVVSLNCDTQLVVEYTDVERRLRLVRGEAHFDVAKHPARPFIVIADNVAARAVGTAFNVRLDADRVEVLVTAGRVQVASLPTGTPGNVLSSPPTPAHASRVLDPGFCAVIAREAAVSEPHVVHLRPDEIARQLAWQPRLIDLSNASLAEIVAEFNRRAAGPGHPRLVLGDPTLADLRIGGSIYLEQPEPFVRLLEKSFNIRPDRDGDTITLRRAR